ncbi:LysM peptidoglycan-binding domain-containing protein [Nocardioides sp. YIM 152315]|uniref:LysM peptidoglycan-binding domain-containing protein n=1 Tax=Nocardioides sp. YIM 152315 TaxID=3031760 RepID=UPI0023DB5F1B|nr:LysM peptidoglycan-binding domain-containing protein [Nocardioides sp. YIM 152315]MDF1605883.1 LysM peptidoglycan-binding domain-containing protein [Nocardioides sp. YIM 152315]
MTTHHSRLRGLAATLTLLLFVAGVPAVLVAIGAIPNPSAFSWSQLTAPDDGTLALEIMTAVCWIAWAIFTCQLIVSITSQIRGIRSPRLPGLVVPQLAADRLVAAAALLFVAVPSAAALLPHSPAEATATVVPTVSEADHNATARATSSVPAATEGADQPDARTAPARPGLDKHEPHLERYTVKRGDSLWRIAEQRLGDGARYVELVELNETILDGRPGFLLPGTVLRVPATAPPDTEPTDGPVGTQNYVVQPGDTLSQIAEAELGDSDAYPAIFSASHDTAQPEGGRLTDPDLILPGWELTIPGTETSEAPPGPRHIKPHHNTDHDTGHVTSHDGTGATRPPDSPATTAPPDPTPAEATPPQVTPSEVAPPEVAAERAAEPPGSVDAGNDAGDGAADPSWLVSGLAGAGSILGGALWLALRAKRRTQLRYRRPGTVIAPAPAELLPFEKTACATASVVAPRIDLLDTALRSLPRHLRLLTVELEAEVISLTLRTPDDLPAPWDGSGTAWEIRLAEVPDRPEDSFPPYPLLASVGRTTDGAFVFLNLEELRTVALTGDPQQAEAFARHLAAELAVNPWSSVTTVDLLGLGADLASFNLGRVRTHPTGDTGFIADLARELYALPEPSARDDFYAAIIATAERPAADLDLLTEVIESIPGRSSAALIDLRADPQTAGAHLEVSPDGRLTESRLGVDVLAAGLSADEARASALLLDLTLDQTTVPVPAPVAVPTPPHAPSPDDAEAVSDLGGALTDEFTTPRPQGPAGEASLLPLAAQAYADAAATTTEDVEVLAPRAVPEARAAVAAADPDLDEDLARWESSTRASAKLILLGPVDARATGDAKATAHRRPFYIELLAFLALNPRGVQAAEVADAFGLKPDRVRVDISQLRRWLGNDPRTGEPYLPKAEPALGPDSPAVYKVQGVLSDLDLFRRLRARAQSRGAEGINDLIRALRLVTGEPFTHLREHHWNWLLDGERWDHIMSAAIVDVGHIVTTHALAADDHDLALWAAQVAYSASPFDEVAQLDIIAAEKAHGGDEQADQDLTEKVFNRRDDDMAPIGVPSRSTQIIDSKSWSTPGSRPRRTG